MSLMQVISNHKRADVWGFLILKELGRSRKIFAHIACLKLAETTVNCVFAERFCELLHTNTLQRNHFKPYISRRFVWESVSIFVSM